MFSLTRFTIGSVVAIATTALAASPAHALNTFLIDFNTPATGQLLPSTPLSISFPSGFIGTVTNTSSGTLRTSLGAGDCRDLGGFCQLTFDFDVAKFEFLLGDRPGGSVGASALDINGNILASIAGITSTTGQAVSFAATGTPFRSLRWQDDQFNLSFIDNVTVQQVPGPLPILGAAAAFGYSRKLRKRIKSSKSEVISTTAV